MINVFFLSLALANPTADSVARSFSMIERQFVGLAEAMPEVKWTFAPKAVWHASDHYGQLVVYLRMNGIVPPASR